MLKQRKSEEGLAESGVFIIEDSEVMQRRYRYILEHNRIDICGLAGSGREAVLKFPLVRPEVLILDHELPDGTGLHIIAALKSYHPDVAIIVISGSITAGMAQQYLAHGVRRLISKPINESQLVVMVRDLMMAVRAQASVAG
ncbi:response regulator [bacterium]|nr:response regulator [bacterium]